MKSVVGWIFVAAVFLSSHTAATSSDCTLRVAEYVKGAETLFEQDRGKSWRSILPYIEFSKKFPILKPCSLQEINEEISKSKYAPVVSSIHPDIWSFQLSDDMVTVGFSYVISLQASRSHYALWKNK